MKLIRNYNNKLLNITLIFLLLCFSILFNKFFNSNIYLAPDTKWYFELANNLKNGKGLFFNELNIYGFQIPNNENGKAFFSVFPPLYSILIAVIDKIFFLDNFIYSSILLNVILVFFLIIFTYFKLKSTTLTLFLLLNSSFIQVYSYSLTELLFLVLCIGLIINYIELHKKYSYKNIFFFIIFFNLCFFTKYIGALLLLGLFICDLLFIIKKKLTLKDFFYNNLVYLISAIPSFIWLFYSYKNTGFITGYDRNFTHYTLFSTYLSLLKIFLTETNYIISSFKNINVELHTIYKVIIYLSSFLFQCYLFKDFIKKFIEEGKFKIYIYNTIGISMLLFTIILYIHQSIPIYFRMTFVSFYLIFLNMIIDNRSLFINYKKKLILISSVSLFSNTFLQIIF